MTEIELFNEMPIISREIVKSSDEQNPILNCEIIRVKGNLINKKTFNKHIVIIPGGGEDHFRGSTGVQSSLDDITRDFNVVQNAQGNKAFVQLVNDGVRNQRNEDKVGVFIMNVENDENLKKIHQADNDWLSQTNYTNLKTTKEALNEDSPSMLAFSDTILLNETGGRVGNDKISNDLMSNRIEEILQKIADYVQLQLQTDDTFSLSFSGVAMPMLWTGIEGKDPNLVHQLIKQTLEKKPKIAETLKQVVVVEYEEESENTNQTLGQEIENYIVSNKAPFVQNRIFDEHKGSGLRRDQPLKLNNFLKTGSSSIMVEILNLVETPLYTYSGGIHFQYKEINFTYVLAYDKVELQRGSTEQSDLKNVLESLSSSLKNIRAREQK